MVTSTEISTRYRVSQFDNETFVVVDGATEQEFCICNEFEGSSFSAKSRAEAVVFILNSSPDEIAKGPEQTEVAEVVTFLIQNLKTSLN